MSDSPEVRRIARRARRLGFTALELGSLSDAGWDAVRGLVDCPDAPNLVLADAVDRIIVLEQGEIVDAPAGSE